MNSVSDHQDAIKKPGNPNFEHECGSVNCFLAVLWRNSGTYTAHGEWLSSTSKLQPLTARSHYQSHQKSTSVEDYSRHHGYIGTRRMKLAALEKHYSVQEVVDLWGWSESTVRRRFRNHPAVLKLGHAEGVQSGSRPYTKLAIPESVLLETHSGMCQPPKPARKASAKPVRRSAASSPAADRKQSIPRLRCPMCAYSMTPVPQHPARSGDRAPI
jgi:hypothetical protein